MGLKAAKYLLGVMTLAQIIQTCNAGRRGTGSRLQDTNTHRRREAPISKQVPGHLNESGAKQVSNIFGSMAFSQKPGRIRVTSLSPKVLMAGTANFHQGLTTASKLWLATGPHCRNDLRTDLSVRSPNSARQD